MRSALVAALAAVALLGWGLPADVEAGGQKSGASAGSTSTDQSWSTGQSAGSQSSGTSTMTPGSSSGAGSTTTGGMTSGAAGSQISSDKLQSYVQVRQRIEQQDPSLKSALESGDLSGHKSELQSALSGSQMTAEEFMDVHEQVQSDPTLRSQVEAQLGASGTSGTSGASEPSGTTTPPGSSPGEQPSTQSK